MKGELLMKLSAAHHLAIIIFTVMLHHTNACMNVIVTIAKSQKDQTQEQGKICITVDPGTDTEATIKAKIISQYTKQYTPDTDTTSLVFKITQANRIRTPLAQLLEEGLSLHKQLILRALIQVH
jgi:hypothetical protein